MAAIAWNESSCGADVKPRYEAAYDFDGCYGKNSIQAELLRWYGSRAAYSYGPWQMMLCNARGYTPDELEDDPEKAAQAFLGFVNRYIIGVQKAQNLEEILQCYNAGHCTLTPTPGVQRYVEDGFTHYSDPRVKAGLEAV